VRRALVPLLAAAALVAGCGGDEEKTTTTTTVRPPTTTTQAVPPLSEVEAVRETQSVASQEAFKRDFSFPASEITATCRPAAAANGKPSFSCRYTSPEDSCKGKVRIVRLADGSNGFRSFTMDCDGPPNIGPDTSDPNFDPDG
jgi:hypothetical protein